METLEDLLKYRENHFTIYAVDNDYANNFGKSFFNSYKDTENYIDTSNKLSRIIKKINQYIFQNTDSTADYINQVFKDKDNRIGAIIKLAVPLIHVVSAEFHQAQKNTLPDPAIIVEGEITSRKMGHFISKVREATFTPKIIVVLKSNNLEQSKRLFQKCPNNTHVQFIKNDGSKIDYKVINTGAKSTDEFLESYVEQCFSTCSKSDKRVIFDKKTEDNDIVKKYMYDLLIIRSDLIYDRKDKVRKSINDLHKKINEEIPKNMEERQIILLLKCIINIYKIYCNDFGGSEILEAFTIAKEINIELINAFVWRYAGFNPTLNTESKNELLHQSVSIFEHNHILDQAVYCSNNLLFSQFYNNSINITDFNRLNEKAINDVPGLVGMSYVYNNVGVANLYYGNPEEAIQKFKIGQSYAKERPFQLYGLKTNELIASSFLGIKSDEEELLKTVKCMDQALGTHDTVFLTANYMANIIAIAANDNVSLANKVIEDFSLNALFDKALNPNMFGFQSLYHQLNMIKEKYPRVRLKIRKMNVAALLNNQRTAYMKKNLQHPTIYNTWL